MYPNVAVIIPSYNSSKKIINVIKKIPFFIKRIYVVDDKCPQNSGLLVKKIFKKNKKILVIFNKKNGGVGYATKIGLAQSLKEKMDMSVKIDSDGQMNPKLIKKFLKPIIYENYDYCKGNRFGKIKNLAKMPIHRILGNIFFSLLGKMTTKNFKVFDFHNGYIAIRNNVLQKINYKKLDNSFFFETHILYRLRKKKLKIKDIDMIAVYEDEKSNLNDLNVGILFLKNHMRLLFGLKN